MHHAIYFILIFFRAGSLLLGKMEKIGALQTPLSSLAGSSPWIKLAELGVQRARAGSQGEF